MSTMVERKLRVVDLAMGWAGPLVGQMLAEMGFEVVKIEDTLRFDWWRGSLSLADRDLRPIERSAVFNSANRGKLGTTLDLSSPRGVELVKRLVADADVVVENYSPGVMKRFGLSYDVLSAINPRLVMVSMPSFGSEGPECEARGYGNTIEAMCGVTGLTGYHDTEQRYTLSNALGDPIGGLNGTFAVLVALRERERTGRGQWVELAQVEAAVPLVADALMEYQLNNRIPHPIGNRHPSHAPHGVYQCAGEHGWVAFSAPGDDRWRAIARVLGIEGDARFATESARKRNEDALDAKITEALRDKTADEIAAALIAAGVAAAPVYSAPEVMSDPQIQARDFFVPIDRAIVGTHLYPGAVAKFSSTPLVTDRPAPLLGEHNRVVFRDILGMRDAEIDALEAQGIIGNEPRE